MVDEQDRCEWVNVFFILADPGSPWQRVVKRLYVYVFYRIICLQWFTAIGWMALSAVSLWSDEVLTWLSVCSQDGLPLWFHFLSGPLNECCCCCWTSEQISHDNRAVKLIEWILVVLFPAEGNVWWSIHGSEILVPSLPVPTALKSILTRSHKLCVPSPPVPVPISFRSHPFPLIFSLFPKKYET